MFWSMPTYAKRQEMSLWWAYVCLTTRWLHSIASSSSFFRFRSDFLAFFARISYLLLTCKFFRPQIALALRARAILLIFEKFTRAYLFQIALELMWLPMQIFLFSFTSQPPRRHRRFGNEAFLENETTDIFNFPLRGLKIEVSIRLNRILLYLSLF